LPEGTDATVVAGCKVQQAVHAAMMRKKNVSFLELLIGAGPGGSVINLHTVSRGTINIDPNNLTAEPIVDYRAMSNPTDMSLIVEMVRYMRKYMASATFAPYKPVETSPGIYVQTDDEIAAWIRGIYSPTVYHPIGTTAKMPRELGGVVDEDLLVYGVQKLSVIDAGIMPSIPGATTSMTVYAIAEKAADIIKSRQ
jgi:choline dehydrogenase